MDPNHLVHLLAALYAVWFGVKLIWPSDTAVNAPFWYITPAIVFGNELLFTLFSTTAATATCPAYGSPLASLYTVLASRFKSLLLVLLLEFELPLELNIPIASSVFFPAIPSAVNPFFLWKYLTAANVSEP